MKIAAIIIFLCGLVAVPGIPSAADAALRFGVIPYLSPSRMDDIYAPVSRALADSLNQSVRFRTSSTIDRFKKNLADASYDVALVVPILYPLVVDKLGYIPLVRMQESIDSLIVVAPDSPYQSLNDLVGKTVGTPPVNGPVVLLARRQFVDIGINPDTDISLSPQKTVGACMQKLLAKQLAACIVPTFAVPTFEKNTGAKLKVLLRTGGVPDRALVVHPRVSEKQREQIKDVLLSWRTTETGEALLDGMNTGGFVEVVDSEYDIVRELIKPRGN